MFETVHDVRVNTLVPDGTSDAGNRVVSTRVTECHQPVCVRSITMILLTGEVTWGISPALPIEMRAIRDQNKFEKYISQTISRLNKKPRRSTEYRNGRCWTDENVYCEWGKCP